MSQSCPARLYAYISLSKPIITLSVAFSALTGFIMYTGSFASAWMPLYLGVLLVAAGSSAINQIQEQRYDRLMERTRHRPLPSGKLSLQSAWLWSVLLVLAGTGILLNFRSSPAWLLALLTLVWYNLVYTPLKRKTPWAIIPGALVGALPPCIGWTAAGGSLAEAPILWVAFFFFMGQIPHFWLILLKYGDDYQQAGFPSVTAFFKTHQIARLTFTWTACTAITALALPLFGVITTSYFSIAVPVLSLALLLSFLRWPDIKQPHRVNRAFMAVNLYFLLMMLIIMGDALWSKV